MSKKIMKKIIALGVILVMSFSFAGCGNKTGSIYNLQQAYDEGLLTIEDLKSIAFYNNSGIDGNEEIMGEDFVPIPKNPENLSAKTEEKIKKDLAKRLLAEKNEDGTSAYPQAKAEDVIIWEYYGTYNNCVVFLVNIPYVFIPDVGYYEKIR